MSGRIAWFKSYLSGGSQSPSDTTGRGTVVADILGGAAAGTLTADNDKPFPGGVAPNASLYFEQTCTSTGSGICPISSTNFSDFAAQNVKIINASFGSGNAQTTFTGSSDPNIASTQAIFQPAVNAGILLVWGAGSTGATQPWDQAGLPHWIPSFQPNWLAVVDMAIDSNGKPAGLYAGSDAPSNACGIAMAWCLSAPGNVEFPAVNEFTGGITNGTSASAAVVSGVAAQVWQAFPWMTAANVSDTILTTATPYDDGSHQTPNPTYGWGMINAAKAINGPAQFAFGDFDANIPSGTTSTFSNDIGGSGGLTLSGPGTLVLTGTNTYNGGTTITAGTLQVGNGGTSGSIVGNVTDNGSLVFNRSNTVTYGGVISGTGSLLQAGPGTLVLTGANTYSGTTTINASALQIGNGGTSGSIVGDVTDNGLLQFNHSDEVTYGGVISGYGKLTQAGIGTLTLTGANTYTDVTNIENGILALADNGSISDSFSIQIKSGGTLDISRTTNGAKIASLDGSGSVVLGGKTLTLTDQSSFPFAGAISGTGGVTLQGGQLVMTGANTYSGLTTINSNTWLTVGGGPAGGLIAGDILNEGTLEFQSSANVVFGGVISGDGFIMKEGASVTLAGNNTFSGPILIRGTSPLIISKDVNLGAPNAVIRLEGTLETTDSFTLKHMLTLESSNASTLQTDDGTVLTVPNVIGGIGALTKSGAGTLVLTGNNTNVAGFYGPTTIAAGTLQIGNGGSNGSIAGSITDNGSLAFDRSDTLNHSGMISGTGTVTQQGSGTLTLTGTNTYTGGTTINSGTLQIGEGGTSGSIVGNVIDNSSLVFNRDDYVIYDGVISGTGSLTYAGTGQLVLTGANTYTGGTTINEGTLYLGHIDIPTGSIVGDVIDNGSLVFAHSDNVTFGGAISGIGSLTQAGTGTLTLTGMNTYSGGTTVSDGGVLAISSNANLGATGAALILDNGTLETTASFNLSHPVTLVDSSGAFQTDLGTNLTISGAISGSRSLTKTGPGILTLTGTNSWSGSVGVTDGVLRATQPLPNLVSVTGSGTLDAVPGVVGDLINEAKIAVHDGETSVGGDYTQWSTGTLAVSLGSKLTVTGTAMLHGGTLEVTGADSGYVASTHTSVLTAAGGVTGTFANLVKDSGVVFTATTIGYGANDVYLDTTGLNITAAATSMGIVAPASVAAAQRVQAGFEAINTAMASGGALASSVLQGAGAIQQSATPAVAQATLTSLSGQLHAASAAMLFNGMDARGNALSEHVDDLVNGGATPGVWYSNLDWQGNLQRNGYTGAAYRSGGGMAGTDLYIGPHALLGFAAGQSLGFGQLDASWDHARLWMNNIAMYGGLVNGPWYASTQVTSGWYREDMQRLLQLGELGAPVGSESAGHYATGALEGGRLFRIGATRIVPFADLRYQRLGLGGFTEQGGLGYGLTAGARTAGRLQAGLGLRAERGWRLPNGMQMAFDGSAGWQHTLHQYGSVFDASFTGFNDWLPVDGIGLSRNTAILRTGLSLWPTSSFGLRLGYMREQGQQERTDSAMLQGMVTF